MPDEPIKLTKERADKMIKDPFWKSAVEKIPFTIDTREDKSEIPEPKRYISKSDLTAMIPVTKEVRDKIKKIKPLNRTYNKFLIEKLNLDSVTV